MGVDEQHLHGKGVMDEEGSQLSDELLDGDECDEA